MVLRGSFRGFKKSGFRGFVALRSWFSTDSVGRVYAKQLVNKVPMVKKRKEELSKLAFHNLQKCDEKLALYLGINIFKNFKNKKDINFIKMMFERRHVHEHNGGVADEIYLKNSGDEKTRLGQKIYEEKGFIMRTIDLVKKLSENLDSGFHEIYPPNEEYLQANVRA